MIRHGHYLGYIADGCRDECCRRPWRAYIGRQRLRARRGEPSRLVDAGPARRHARGMQGDWGVSPIRVLEAGGIERSYAKRIMSGETKRIDRDWSEAVLHVTLSDLPPSTLLPVAHVGPLVAEFQGRYGWDRNRIARECGLPVHRLQLRHIDRTQVSTWVALRARLDAACAECGAPSWEGGRWCWDCYGTRRRSA